MKEKRNIRKYFYVLVIVAALFVWSTTSAQPTEYRASNWADAINYAPCDMFQRTADGTWVIPKMVLGRGTNISSNQTFTGDRGGEVFRWATRDLTIVNLKMTKTRETRILERRCSQQK
jgi:hypothetical protein